MPLVNASGRHRQRAVLAVLALGAVLAALAVWRRSGEGPASDTGGPAAAATHRGAAPPAVASRSHLRAAAPSLPSSLPGDGPAIDPDAPHPSIKQALAEATPEARCNALAQVVHGLRGGDDLDVTFAPLPPPVSSSSVALERLDLGTTRVSIPSADYRVRVVSAGASRSGRPMVGLLAPTVTVMIGPGLGDTAASDVPGMPDLRGIDVYQEAFTTRRSDYHCDPAAVDDGARIAAELVLKDILMPHGPGRLRAIPCTDPDRVVLLRDADDRVQLEAQWVADGAAWSIHLEAGPRDRDAVLAMARQLAGPAGANGTGAAPPDAVATAARVAAGDRSAAQHLLDIGALDPMSRRSVEDWLSRPAAARPTGRDAAGP